MAHRSPAGARKGDVLRVIAEALVPYLRELLQPPTASPQYYSQLDSPLGRRRHLELARRGTLPRKKVGRMVLVRREDLDAFIDSQHPVSAAEPYDEADILADWDLAPRSRK